MLICSRIFGTFIYKGICIITDLYILCLVIVIIYIIYILIGF